MSLSQQMIDDLTNIIFNPADAFECCEAVYTPCVDGILSDNSIDCDVWLESQEMFMSDGLTTQVAGSFTTIEALLSQVGEPKKNSEFLVTLKNGETAKYIVDRVENMDSATIKLIVRQ